MKYTYLIGILTLKFLYSLFNKKSSIVVDGISQYISYGAYRYLLSALLAVPLLFISGIDASKFSLSAVMVSALAAVAQAISLFCSLEAMKSGAMVLVTLAGAAGLLIPCILGIFIFNEPMDIWQLIGILLLFGSAYLLIGYSKELSGKFTPKTILLLLGAMFTNGAVMVAQKIFSLYVPDADASVFSLLSFLIAGLIFVAAGLRRRAAKNEKAQPMSKNMFVYGAILSVVLLFINQLATLAAAVIPSAILFSVNDGGGMVITALVAAIFFGEKLNSRSSAGIAFSIFALLIINLL